MRFIVCWNLNVENGNKTLMINSVNKHMQAMGGGQRRGGNKERSECPETEEKKVKMKESRRKRMAHIPHAILQSLDCIIYA